MGLASPLWLILGALGVLVIALHAQRRQQQVVPSLLIWRRVGPMQARRRPFRLPPLTLPLLAQLLALALLALALSGPLVGRAPPQHRIFVVDTSVAPAQTGTIDLRRLFALAGEMSADEQHPVSVVLAGAAPRIAVARDTRADDLAERLGVVEPQESGIDAARTVELVHALIAKDETTRITVVSDRSGDGGALMTQLGAGAAEFRLAAASPARANLNVHLVPVDLSKQIWKVEGLVTFRQGDLPSGRPSSVKVLFEPSGSDQFLDWGSLPLGNFETRDALSSAALSQEVTLPDAGTLVIILPGNATVAQASQRFVIHNAIPQLRVLNVGSPDPSVVRALQAVPGVALFQSDTLPPSTSNFDAVVIDDVEVPQHPDTNTLWIGTARLAGSIRPTPLVSAAATTWESAHVLSRGLNWSTVADLHGFEVPAWPGATTLLGVAGHPLIQARSTPHGRELYLALDLGVTSWTEEPAFPTLLSNFLRWSEPREVQVVDTPCSAGALCPLPGRLVDGTVSRIAESVELSAQDTPPVRLVPPSAVHTSEGWIEPAVADATTFKRPGLYRLSGSAATYDLAVNGTPYDLASPLPADLVADPAMPDLSSLAQETLLILAAIALLIDYLSAGRGAEGFIKPALLRGGHPRAIRNRWIASLGAVGFVLVLIAASGAPVYVWTAGARLYLGYSDSGIAQAIVLADTPHVATTIPSRDDVPGNNIADALLLADGMLRSEQSGRVLLDWNGRNTRGDINAAIDRLQARNLAVDVREQRHSTKDVAIREVDGPNSVYAGESLTLTGLVSSFQAQSATLTLSRNGTIIATRTVSLPAGESRLDIETLAPETGDSVYGLAVSSSEDDVPENNSAGLAVTIAPRPKVALISSGSSDITGLQTALTLQGFDAVALSSKNSPGVLKQWLAFDAFVLIDVPATDLSTAQQSALRRAVRDNGRGLLLLGGRKAFGPGGYYETTFEDLSPLSSRVPRDAPKTGIVFVLDRSGSMYRDEGGSSRLAITKAATRRAVALLNPESQVGIVAFDNAAHVVVPMQAAKDTATIDAALATLDADGGTSVYPGLQQAVDLLSSVDLPVRKIVVMSDGLTQPGDFETLLARARSLGITVSAIAVGDAADPTSLSEIAKLGGGNFHWSRDFRALPGIMADEAMMASETSAKTRVVTPEWQDRTSRFLAGLPTALPPLGGYVETTPKARAHLHLMTSDEQGNVVPLLASWYFGAGTVVAFPSDVTGPWAQQWVASSEFPRFWAQVVRGAVPAPSSGNARVSVSRVGDTAHVSVEPLDESGEVVDSPVPPFVTVTGPGQSAPMPIRMTAMEGGFFGGEFPVALPGLYSIGLRGDGRDVAARYLSNYPAVFAPDTGNGDLSSLIAAATGGRVLRPTDQPPPVPGSWTSVSGWRVYALLAIAVFFAGLTVRYLPGLFGGSAVSSPRRMAASGAAPPGPGSTPNTSKQENLVNV